MPKGTPQKLPTGIAPKTRTRNGKTVPVMTEDGTPVGNRRGLAYVG